MMRTGDNTLERFQTYVPEDYPWQMIRRLTEASSDTEVIRSAISSYAALHSCENEGRTVLVANKEGVYQRYALSSTRHDNLKRMTFLLPPPIIFKLEFMASAKIMDKSTLVRDSLDFYRKIVIEAAFERPVLLEFNSERIEALFAPLLNVAVIAKRMGLGAKKPEPSPT